MDEAKLGGVQRLTVKTQVFQYLPVGGPGPAVDRIADQRVADRGHMHAHLMGPTGLEPAFDQSGVAERL